MGPRSRERGNAAGALTPRPDFMLQTSVSPDQIAGSRRSERPIRQASSTATQKKDHADLDEASHNGEVDPGPVVTVTLEELPQSIYGHGDQPQEEDIHHQRLAGAGVVEAEQRLLLLGRQWADAPIE